MKKTMYLLAVLLFIAAMFTACGTSTPPAPSVEDDGSTVKITGCGVDATYTLTDMLQIEGAAYEGHYSAINNWPTDKFHSAKGVSLSALLKHLGVWDTFGTITFRASDGYEVSFTHKQFAETERYYFPNLSDKSAEGAAIVEPMLAYAAADEIVTDFSETERCSFSLLFGQEYIGEHNNVAFVENISEIILSETVDKWDAPTIFPTATTVTAGETVKLQHPYFNTVKLFYTLDGTEPSVTSTMYNPSTYQPELNTPIEITETVTIKAVTIGYGKENSDVAEFHITAD